MENIVIGDLLCFDAHCKADRCEGWGPKTALRFRGRYVAVSFETQGTLHTLPPPEIPGNGCASGHVRGGGVRREQALTPRLIRSEQDLSA
jgi:hypothetical protein